METSVLRRSLDSRQFRESSFATLSVTLVFSMDVLIDHLTNAYSKHAYWRYTKHKDIVVDSETMLFIAGTVVVPILALLPTSPEASLPLALIYTCASQAQLILLSGFVGVMCCRYFTSDFPFHWTFLFIAVFGGSSVIRPYAINVSGGPITLFRNVCYYMHAPGIMIYLLCAIRWLYNYRLVLWRRSRGNVGNSVHTQLNKYAELFPMTYALSAIVCITFIFINSGTQTDFYYITPASLLAYNVPVLFFQACLILLRSQFSK